LPGVNTTANLLFSYAYPEVHNKIFMRFDLIEDFVIEKSSFEENFLGVIIHENRFTYQQKGLHKIADLGQKWEEKTKMPVPLGGIAVNKTLKRDAAIKINELIRKSLEFAFNNYPEIPEYVKLHSQTMSEEVMRKHINLYVNDYSLNIGVQGKKAIEHMYGVYLKMHHLQQDGEKNLFL
jgi:1,4-dihydroxy-6-naphthoate synthase